MKRQASAGKKSPPQVRSASGRSGRSALARLRAGRALSFVSADASAAGWKAPAAGRASCCERPLPMGDRCCSQERDSGAWRGRRWRRTRSAQLLCPGPAGRLLAGARSLAHGDRRAHRLAAAGDALEQLGLIMERATKQLRTRAGLKEVPDWSTRRKAGGLALANVFALSWLLRTG